MITVISKPIVSEKSFNAAGSGVYTFRVLKGANKKEVAAEIKRRFKVDAVGVKIVNLKGKVKRVGRKFGQRSNVKKAYVKVKKGQQIAIFETEKGKKEVSTRTTTQQKTQKENNKSLKKLKSLK